MFLRMDHVPGSVADKGGRMEIVSLPLSILSSKLRERHNKFVIQTK